MKEFCPASVFKRVRPNGAVRRIQPYPEHGQQAVTIPGDKIGDSPLRIELHDFPPVQAAQIIKIPLFVVRQPFWDKVSLFGNECESSCSDRRKIAMDFFHQVLKFL